MQVGDYYQVDMTGTVYLSSIVLNNSQTSGNGLRCEVRRLQLERRLELDQDCHRGRAGATTTIIPFTKTLMRYVKVQINTPATQQLVLDRRAADHLLDAVNAALFRRFELFGSLNKRVAAYSKLPP